MNFQSLKAWIIYGGILFAHVAAGGFSMYRPAADIFLAGCTQFVPTGKHVFVVNFVYTFIALSPSPLHIFFSVLKCC